MNLSEHYERLYRESIEKIRSGAFYLDSEIDSPLDTRHGITLLLRPPRQLCQQLSSLLERLRSIEPAQYYYPETDFHVTVMSIITCRSGFTLKGINIDAYAQVIRQSLRGLKPFAIHFRGLCASPGCILIQGFPSDDTLNTLRDRLRSSFKNSPLEETIDQRYSLQTAHSTVVRFRKPFQNLPLFLDAVEKTREYDFGSFGVHTLELVYNDWYQRHHSTQSLAKFLIPQPEQ